MGTCDMRLISFNIITRGDVYVYNDTMMYESFYHMGAFLNPSFDFIYSIRVASGIFAFMFIQDNSRISTVSTA